jgi:ATP-dependent exoDNAse (exonuclease V) beta subunit
VAQIGTDRDRPRPGTLLAHLWPLVAERFGPAEETAAAASAPQTSPALQPVLRRLADIAAAPPSRQPPATPSAPLVLRPEFEWVGQAAVHVGTVVHRALQRIAADGVGQYDAGAVQRHADTFRHELALLGVEPGELATATARVVTALARVLEHDRGRWVLDAHAEARSELRLTVPAGAGFEHIRLDRTFVADGKRWIVDFKTSQHQGGDLEAFVETEVERYRGQLDRYARAMAAVDPRPIEVALYFPLLQILRSWQPSL